VVNALEGLPSLPFLNGANLQRQDQQGSAAHEFAG
jgi:hypothetical protein